MGMKNESTRNGPIWKYTFEKLTDLSILTEDELIRWFEDFKIWIAFHRGRGLPPELEGLVKVTDRMIWTDDGEVGINETSIRVDPTMNAGGAANG